MSASRAVRTALIVVLACIWAAPARADGPEQLEQLEPSAGEWQAEYAGSYGGADAHGAQLLYGLSDRIAIGGEAEFEGRRFESVAATALWRINDPETAALGLGVEVQAAIGRDGRFAEAEARAIAERRGTHWWMQGDLILRHAREDGASGTGLAYALSAQRALGEGAWLGIEASGQLARIDGTVGLAPAGQHYLGPSLTIERERDGRRGGIEIGVAWMARIEGEGPRSGPRIFVQLSL